MADKPSDTALRAKLAKLIEAARELQEKQAAILDEIDALLGGKAGIGATMKALETAFDVAWCARYAPGQTGRYVWRYAIDRPHEKRLLKMLELDELVARASSYLANDDPFYVRQRHPFGVFVSSINSHAGRAPSVEAFGCRHDPRCTSDAEHTHRKLMEVRA